MSRRSVETMFVLAAVLASPCRAGAAPAPCQDLAGLIRAGLADGDGKGALFGQFVAMAARTDGHIQVDNSGGADVDAVFRRAKPTPALVRVVQQSAARSDSMEPRVFWFGRSGLGMVQSAGKMPECQPDVVFFKIAHGKAEAVPAPDIAIQGNACSTLTTWATTIGNIPVLVVQDDKVVASKEHLTLVPWGNGAWGPVCGLTVSYIMVFRGTGDFCRPDVNCRDMGAVARGVALRFRTDLERGMNFLADGAATDVPDELVKLAALNKGLGELPIFSKDPDVPTAEPKTPVAPTDGPTSVRQVSGLILTEHGYTDEVPPHLDQNNEIKMDLLPGTKYLHHILYPVRMSPSLTAGGLALGVIGPSRSINNPIGGLLISIWVRSGSGLTPVAGFQNEAVRSKVAQVEIDPAL